MAANQPVNRTQADDTQGHESKNEQLARWIANKLARNVDPEWIIHAVHEQSGLSLPEAAELVFQVQLGAASIAIKKYRSLRILHIGYTIFLLLAVYWGNSVLPGLPEWFLNELLGPRPVTYRLGVGLITFGIIFAYAFALWRDIREQIESGTRDSSDDPRSGRTNTRPRPQSYWQAAKLIFYVYAAITIPGILVNSPPYEMPHTATELILWSAELFLGWFPILILIVIGFENGLALVSKWEGSRPRALGILTLFNAMAMKNAFRLALLLVPLGFPISSSVNLFGQVLIVSLKWVGVGLWAFVDPMPLLTQETGSSDRTWARLWYGLVALVLMYGDLKGLLIAAQAL